MLMPVLPVDQVIVPAHPVAVIVAISSPHTVALSVVNTGADAVADVPIVTVLDAADTPHDVVQVAV